MESNIKNSQADQLPQNECLSLRGDPNMLLPISMLGLAKKQNRHLSSFGINMIGELLASSIGTIKKIFDMEARIQIDSALWQQGYALGEGYKEGISFWPKHGISEVRKAYALSADIKVPIDWIPVAGREALKNEPVQKPLVSRGFCIPSSVRQAGELQQIQIPKFSVPIGPH